MPPYPYKPPSSPCDCLSPIIDNHSKWRFRFQESEALGDKTIFIFTLSFNPSAKCSPVSYRPGDCCNQALDAVSLALDPLYAGLVQYVKVYTYDGKDITVKYVQDAASGLSITLPYMLYSSDIPVGQFFTFEISFAASDWADTTKMPCRPSTFEPSLPACDYWVHGWQTEPGNPANLLTPDERTAGCCPEGVVSFCNERIKGTCNPRLSDSPFRLNYVNTSMLLRTTSVAFTVTSQTVTNALGPKEGLPDCAAMNLQAIKLYVADVAAAKVTQVALNGASVTFSVKKDAAGTYVDAAVPANRAGTGNWVVTLGERFNQTDVCGYKVGQYSVCNYVFSGKSGQCCTMGDVAVATIDRPVIKFG
ncbi:hypothetical protein TSOC_002196 [Tetrabaena socialis]|uniref:Pherophorin domain-containing protein n=1 Tax=Tetrabaena socialis TaxID=47790 RepID=A0A2J8AEP9_9CHLO|nr:hypothetical protein TSOC_002196 [Tetrabaena socialis]|eukprot:PNH11001.1 hypothetical protein TSOC_002196 [Tetrabaena socialis]